MENSILFTISNEPVYDKQNANSYVAYFTHRRYYMLRLGLNVLVEILNSLTRKNSRNENYFERNGCEEYVFKNAKDFH